MLKYCKRCPLYAHYNGFSHKVLGDAGINANYMLVGEAPGVEEI